MSVLKPNMTGDSLWVRLGVVHEGLAQTSFMSMFSGAGVETTAGSVANGGWTTTVTPNSGELGSLQRVLSTGSMISAGLGGVFGYQSKMAQADAETLSAQAEAIRIKRDLVQKIGSARVAFAGSGLDISSGGAIEQSLVTQGDYETGLAKQAGALRAGAIRTQGIASLISAAGTAARDYGDLSYSRVRRG